MRGRRAAVVALLGLAVAGGAGCGSSNSSSSEIATHAATVTETVPAPATTTPSTSSHTSSATTPPPSSTAAVTPTAPASATVPDRTTGGASAPPPTSGGTLSAAEAKVRSLGYQPTVTYGYKPSNTLGVVVGTGAHSQWAFFFVNGRYIGTDTSAPSSGIAIVGQSDTSVTLRYAIYDNGAKLCCPSTYTNVTYALNDGKLEPEGSVPSAASRTGG